MQALEHSLCCHCALVVIFRNVQTYATTLDRNAPTKATRRCHLQRYVPRVEAKSSCKKNQFSLLGRGPETCVPGNFYVFPASEADTKHWLDAMRHRHDLSVLTESFGRIHRLSCACRGGLASRAAM